jgi:hypothetical protein
MRIIFIIFLIGSIWFCTNCTNKRQKEKIKQMKIEIEIIPESTSGNYSIAWNDTLCSEFKSELNYLQKRPYEIHCNILDKRNDTIGYYRGLSTPQQFTYFHTNYNADSIIYLWFSVGVNSFSEYNDSSNVCFNEPYEFKPIKIDLRTDLRKKINFILKNE